MEALLMKKVKLSKTVKELIQQAINSTNSSNKYAICEKLALILEEKYLSRNLDYQLERMSIDTTKKILNAIDVYLTHYTY